MKTPGHAITALALVAALTACDSVDLTIDVRPASDGGLEIVNANDQTWTDARLVVETVETDNSTAPCAEKTIANWAPGEPILVPRCGNKTRFTLTTGGKTSRFSYSNGQLFRLFGRKEVPVAGSTSTP